MNEPIPIDQSKLPWAARRERIALVEPTIALMLATYPELCRLRPHADWTPVTYLQRLREARSVFCDPVLAYDSELFDVKDFRLACAAGLTMHMTVRGEIVTGGRRQVAGFRLAAKFRTKADANILYGSRQVRQYLSGSEVAPIIVTGLSQDQVNTLQDDFGLVVERLNNLKSSTGVWMFRLAGVPTNI